jgi:IMP dehydrogenase/GMP reductase
MRKYLTFDDVGMIPKFNKIASRLDTSIKTLIGKDTFGSPFVPANMDSVICPRLAKICKDRNAPIIFHRFAPIEQQVKWVKDFPESYTSIGV